MASAQHSQHDVREHCYRPDIDKFKTDSSRDPTDTNRQNPRMGYLQKPTCAAVQTDILKEDGAKNTCISFRSPAW
jgi:hypothetical protein